MVVVGCCNRVEKLAYVYTITKVFFLAKNMQLFLMKTTPSLPFGTSCFSMPTIVLWNTALVFTVKIRLMSKATKV